MMKVKPVKLGKTERMSFSHIDEVISMPNLIEVQKNSYQWFLDEGLKEVFHDIGTIEDYTGNLALSFVDFRLDKEPKYSIKECKERDVTYAAPLRVTARLLNKETGEVKDQEIFMGDFPLMTDAGTFVINGAERVIVSQLVRSPGVYNDKVLDKNGVPRYATTVIPNRGAWLEYEQDSNEVQWVHVDRTRKITATTLLRALGYGTDELPAFYTRSSGFGVDYRVDTPAQLAAMFKAQQELGMKGGMLVTNPIPEQYAMDKAVIDAAIEQAVAESKEQGIHGKETTPFLLARVVELTGGDSLESNIQLVLNNAIVASKTAAELCK